MLRIVRGLVGRARVERSASNMATNCCIHTSRPPTFFCVTQPSLNQALGLAISSRANLEVERGLLISRRHIEVHT